jgi:hypothetical protein
MSKASRVPTGNVHAGFFKLVAMNEISFTIVTVSKTAMPVCDKILHNSMRLHVVAFQ